MDIIETHGGSINYDEIMDAEPIVIDGIPYMVMGHAQYYVDSRIMHCANMDDTCDVYRGFVTGNAIDYQALLDDIVANSGLSKLLNRHIDSLGSLWRMIDDFDDATSGQLAKRSGKIPDRPKPRPSSLTPAALKEWAESVAKCVVARGIKVPAFRYPRKCNWISETSPPSHKSVTLHALMEADMVCCRYAECLESAYVYTAKYLNDIQDAVVTAIKKR